MKSIISRCIAASALGLLTLSGTAFAQYVWLDERGVKQYSDMPPPPSVPANRILKQHGPYAPPTSAAGGTSSDAASLSAKTEMSIAEKNAEFRKRRSEQAEKEKKADEETKAAADKAKTCQRAREYHQALDSGERITRRDKNGEQYFLSDEQRNREVREVKRTLDECK